MAGALVLAASAAAATPPPERDTEWSPVRLSGPYFYCVNGMGVELRQGEQLQVASYVPHHPLELMLPPSGPLTRIQLERSVIEIQWPGLASEDNGSMHVYWNTRLTLTARSRDGWTLSLDPGNPRDLERRLPTPEELRQSIHVYFPVGEHSGEGLEFARRLEYVAPSDPRCSNRNGN